jgi:hypothetical protein
MAAPAAEEVSPFTPDALPAVAFPYTPAASGWAEAVVPETPYTGPVEDLASPRTPTALLVLEAVSPLTPAAAPVASP